MAITVMEEITCSCGEVFEAEVVQSVSAQTQPELKEMVLAGELNIVQCPACKKFIFAEKFLLYHDAEQELLAFVYPLSMESRKVEIQESVLQQYRDLQQELVGQDRLQYQPFLLFGLDRLCDLIHLEEQRQDEFAIAASLCETLGLTFYRIHQDAARKQNLPVVLPLGRAGKAVSLHERLLQGLQILVETNPALESYAELLRRLQEDPSWTLDPAWLKMQGDELA